MTTQFKSNSSVVQQKVCIDPLKFQDGQIPKKIIVTYGDRFSYNYKLSHVDGNGNYCYDIEQLGGFARKKRRVVPPTPCPTICIIGTGNAGPTTPCSGTTQALQSAGELNLYSNQLIASGGNSPYTFIVTSGALPPDLTLSIDGLISGTPPAFSSATYTFAVQATDSSGCKGTQVFTIQVTND